MAQYYQVTSLEELHRLYPNLQIDNLEGIPCMIQDDQVTQYTDGQGQQVVATIDQSGMQFSQNPSVSHQCSPQQQQYIVHQPTQYMIQQMKTSESQTQAVQYIKQKRNEEMSEVNFEDQKIGCMGADITNEENTHQQNVLKQEDNKQFVSQVQPIQIHKQVQAVDMGGNILVVRNREQQDVLSSQDKRQEFISNQNQEMQQQHLIIQRHQQPRPQQVITQRPQSTQKEEISSQKITHQILQSRRASQGENQHQSVIYHSQPQVIQQLQYYNQVTVLDTFSQPNVTIEHQAPLNESMEQEELAQSQVQQEINQSESQQQFKPKKIVQHQALPNTQQQVLIPQRFEMASPSLTNKIVQHRKKGSQQEVESPPTPVFIVQKLDSPFVIRQPQTKIRFQTPSLSNEKVSDGSFQTPSFVQSEINPENVAQENQLSHSQQRSYAEMPQQTVNIAGSQNNRLMSEKNQNCGQIRIGMMEQPFGGKVIDQVNKSKVISTVINRASGARIKTVEQQTEPMVMNETKETTPQHYEKPDVQAIKSVSASSPQPQLHTQTQNQGQTPGRGRAKGSSNVQFSRGGQQFVQRARGVQVQTSPLRPPNVEETRVGKRLKSPRKGGRGGRGGWVPCGFPQRQPSPVRPVVSQVIQTVGTKGETSQGSNENVEEARMVVLLLNGEKKVIRMPCNQQNILLGQILHQAGLQISSPTQIAIEQVIDNPNSEQFIIRNSTTNSQQSTPQKPNVSQTVSNSVITPRSIVTTPQRPRGQSPSLSQGSNVGIIRHRQQLGNPRTTSNSAGSQAISSPTMVSESGVQSTPNSTPSAVVPQKEEPRFVNGFMAVCPFCGISSLDFNKCIRCRRKLPENVKLHLIFNSKKKKTEKATTGVEKTSEECKSDSEEKQSDSPNYEDKDKTTPDKKKPKPLRKKKVFDEPTEILILSSDEEEDAKTKKTNVNQQTLNVLKKEPLYTATEFSDAEMSSFIKENSLNEELMKNVQPGSFTTLQCRTVRIGSYKVQPKERVLVSTKGIRLVVNSLKNENAAIVIPNTNILKVLIHFGKQIPVIFIYPLPKVGLQIRNLLGMNDKGGPYYDPASTQEEAHKRITLLLDKFSEDNKITLIKIFGQGKLEELTEKEANEILIRASPVEVQNAVFNKPSDDIKKIMVYPPPPEKGGITLHNQDYACLGEDQFLNDVIIDFYLKYLMLKVLSPEDRNRTHVFSTFFYKRLTTKPKASRKNDPENDPKLSPAEKRHLRVKKWTKQVNLFEKDFIIVPINEHSHWFLAIICFPGLTGPVKFSDNTPVDPEEILPKKNNQSVQIGSTTITQIIKSDGKMVSLEMDSGSDRDEAEGDQDDLHPSSDDEGSEPTEEESNTSSQAVQIPLLEPPPQQPSVKEPKVKTVKKKPFKEPIKQPCILIFDSLAGASRVRVVATLRDYLKIEYKKKMGKDRDFSKDTIKGAVPKVPQQNNFTDCGLYVLQYVESFFQDPLHDFKLPLKYLQDWFPEEVVSSKRQKLALLIKVLMEEQGLNVEQMGLPVLTFTNGNNATDDQSKMEEEEVDEEEDEEVEDEEEMNEEEDGMMRNQIHISEFDNEDDEDMDIEDEEDEGEDEELDEEEDEDEELEIGEIPRHWIAGSRSSCSELESSVHHVGGRVLIKTSSLVDYGSSDSDEEDTQNLSRNSEMISTDQTSLRTETAEEGEYCESEQSVISESRKNVPLTELQDFESQISCTTIERNFDGRNSESDMVISEEDEEEEEGEVAENEDGTSFVTSEGESTNTVTDSFSQTVQTIERRHFQPTEVIVKENKAIEVTDLLQKLVNDKNITISRKEHELNSNLFKKQFEVKRFKVKDCDKSDEGKKVTSTNIPQKNNIATCKRSFQALKSVRIPKKAERKLELCSKRQKVDER